MCQSRVLIKSLSRVLGLDNLQLAELGPVANLEPREHVGGYVLVHRRISPIIKLFELEVPEIWQVLDHWQDHLEDLIHGPRPELGPEVDI